MDHPAPAQGKTMLTIKNFTASIFAAIALAAGIAAFAGLNIGGGGGELPKPTPSMTATLPGTTSQRHGAGKFPHAD